MNRSDTAILFGLGTHFVSAKANPELAELQSQYEKIGELFNDVNRSLTIQHVPPSPGRRDKDRYNELANRVIHLEKRMLEWESEALKFIQVPAMEIESPKPFEPAIMTMLNQHIVHVITALRHDTITRRTLLTQNYNRLTAEADSNRNFRIAMHSYWLAWCGLFLALVGLAYSIFS